MSEASKDHTENQEALAVVRRLVDVLERRAGEEIPAVMEPLPTTASEFGEVLERLHEAGSHFNEDGIVSLAATSPENEESAGVISELASRFPFLPREVRHLVNVVLKGDKPNPAIVGEPGELSGKLAALKRFVLTPELEERYFVRRVSKAPVIIDVDWGVGIKTAERGWRGTRGIPFAEVAFTLTNYNLPDEDASRVVHACVNEAMLVRLLDDLEQALAALREAKQIAVRVPLENTDSSEDS